jgi:glycine/D-amino acid oxidase-like deaminating enzyme
VSGRERGPLLGDHSADVLVVGGGIPGLAVARELARRGVRVVVLEAGTTAAAGAADLGHVLVGLREPYAKTVARLGRERARGVWEQLREGHERLREAVGSLSDDCDLRRAGGFRLALDREAGTSLADSEDMLREDAFSGEFLDHWMLEARFDIRGFAAAYWGADDGELDARRLARALALEAEGHGAALHEASAVLDLDLSERSSEAVTARGRLRAELALVTGSTAGHVTALEACLVVRATRHLRVALHSQAQVPSPALVMEAPFQWTRAGGGLLVSAVGQPPWAWAERHLPASSTAGPEDWSGVRFETPDGLPLVGRVPGLAALVSCGHEVLGPGSALLAARWLAETVTRGLEAAPDAFRVERVFESPEPPK